ncbi:hypothetical protein GmHk_15G043332 [Glycine max]|nr:hypothetical protein GmHk_15G043332 [Glycine max]
MWSLRCLSRRFVDPQRSWSTPFGEIPLDRWYIRYLHNGMVSSTSSSELGKFHHGGWTAKIVIWLLLVVLAFFLPDAVILVYGIKKISQWKLKLNFKTDMCISVIFTRFIAKFGAGLYIALLAVSVGCYIAAFTGSGILFFWFNPSGYDCSLNIFFFVMTMILAFVFAIIALHPQVNGSLLPSAVISLYCAYVCSTRGFLVNLVTMSAMVSTSPERSVQCYRCCILLFGLDSRPHSYHHNLHLEWLGANLSLKKQKKERQRRKRKHNPLSIRIHSSTKYLPWLACIQPCFFLDGPVHLRAKIS